MTPFTDRRLRRRDLLGGLAAAPLAGLPGRARSAPAPVAGFRVVAAHPHDPAAFTQGLAWADGELWEGTGLVGQSEVRRVDLATGTVLERRSIAPGQFGEGIAFLGERLYQLTWLSGVCHVWKTGPLKLAGNRRYRGQGWGLASDGHRLYMSDGSATVTVRNRRFDAVRRISVRDGGEPVPLLNELEWVAGELWANVFRTDRIVRVDPATGNVIGWIDLAGLRQAIPEPERPTAANAVLNGIAHDPASGRILVTGKLWPRLFEIEVAGAAA